MIKNKIKIIAAYIAVFLGLAGAILFGASAYTVFVYLPRYLGHTYIPNFDYYYDAFSGLQKLSIPLCIISSFAFLAGVALLIIDYRDRTESILVTMRTIDKIPPITFIGLCIALYVISLLVIDPKTALFKMDSIGLNGRISGIVIATVVTVFLTSSLVRRIRRGHFWTDSPLVHAITTIYGSFATKRIGTKLIITGIGCALITLIVGLLVNINVNIWFLLIVIVLVILTLFFCFVMHICNMKKRLATLAEFTTASDIPKHPHYLDDAYDTMEKLNQAFQQAVENSIRNERTKTELITNVSHDIKTPLTSIINYTDLLQKEGITDEERTEYLSVLSRQSVRLKKLIEDLIEASKATTGNMELIMGECNLGTLISQAVTEFDCATAARSLSFVTKLPDTPIIINTDGSKLYRVFENLLSNACKYSLNNSRIFVELLDNNGKISIIFTNTSADILSVAPDELTERFVRGDMSRTDDGNGLGLAIAKSITELLGGELEIRMERDIFIVELKFIKE